MVGYNSLVFGCAIIVMVMSHASSSDIVKRLVRSLPTFKELANNPDYIPDNYMPTRLRGYNYDNDMSDGMNMPLIKAKMNRRNKRSSANMEYIPNKMSENFYRKKDNLQYPSEALLRHVQPDSDEQGFHVKRDLSGMRPLSKYSSDIDEQTYFDADDNTEYDDAFEPLRFTRDLDSEDDFPYEFQYDLESSDDDEEMGMSRMKRDDFQLGESLFSEDFSSYQRDFSDDYDSIEGLPISKRELYNDYEFNGDVDDDDYDDSQYLPNEDFNQGRKRDVYWDDSYDDDINFEDSDVSDEPLPEFLDRTQRDISTDYFDFDMPDDDFQAIQDYEDDSYETIRSQRDIPLNFFDYSSEIQPMKYNNPTKKNTVPRKHRSNFYL